MRGFSSLLVGRALALRAVTSVPVLPSRSDRPRDRSDLSRWIAGAKVASGRVDIVRVHRHTLFHFGLVARRQVRTRLEKLVQQRSPAGCLRGGRKNRAAAAARRCFGPFAPIGLKAAGGERTRAPRPNFTACRDAVAPRRTRAQKRYRERSGRTPSDRDDVALAQAGLPGLPGQGDHAQGHAALRYWDGLRGPHGFRIERVDHGGGPEELRVPQAVRAERPQGGPLSTY